ARVLARSSGRALSARAAQTLADERVPRGQGWAWNQAMIDLGATVCLRRAPRCGECPLCRSCKWRGGPDPAWPATRQSIFAGSDRQGRGRLVDALRRGPVPIEEVAAACGGPANRARAMLAAQLLSAGGRGNV